MYYRKSLTAIALVLSVVALGASAVPPDEHKPQNLKILPRNISHDELKKVMDGFKNGLGVKCGFCHAKNAADSAHLDFASDAKPEKEVARHMLKMVMKVNKKYFEDMKSDDGKLVQVSCYTCHHGHEKPEQLN